MNSARRRKMTSKAPPASPALIMLTYRRLKHLGDLDIDSERVAPPSMPSQTSIRAFLRPPALACDSRILRLRRIGRPASCRMESWRVKAHRSFPLAPPSDRDRRLVLM